MEKNYTISTPPDDIRSYWENNLQAHIHQWEFDMSTSGFDYKCILCGVGGVMYRDFSVRLPKGDRVIKRKNVMRQM